MQSEYNHARRRGAIIRRMFDTEQFIKEVERRESIWNQKSPQYSDRLVKNRQWNELVDLFGDEDISAEDRVTICENLQKKWKNIRDNYVKEYKTVKSGSATKRKSRYVYYDQLSFLKEVLTNNVTDSNLEVPADVQESTNSTNSVRWQEPAVEVKEKSRTIPYAKEKVKYKKKKEDPDDFSKEFISVLHKSQEQRAEYENDPDRLFFLSLVKDFKNIPEYLQLETKCQIMELIKNARFQHGTSYPKSVVNTIPGPSGNLDPDEAAAILRACDAISPSSEASQGSE